MKGSFPGTVAPPDANLTLLLEIAMGVGLLIGAFLARRQRFGQHAWCQSVIVLLNLAVIVLVMIPSFSSAGDSEDTAQTWQGLLRTGDDTRGVRNDKKSRDCTFCWPLVPGFCRINSESPTTSSGCEQY